MYTFTKIIAISSLTLVLAACGSAKDANKRNFGKAIQAYLDTQNGLCAAVPAQDLPFTLANTGMFNQQYKQRADALVDAGLLNRRDTEIAALFGPSMTPATEYQVSDMGKKYLVGQKSAFCTGKYALVEVDNFTDPSDMMGVKVSRVKFRYKVENLADWAHSERLRAAYQDFADPSQTDIPQDAALILTNDGWMHERLFQH